jgi:uncharacterized protein with von Willebrand factor type A (vWA) domain
MEGWKLQTAINNFTDACETNSPHIVKFAKDLRRTYDHLRNPAQQQDVLEQIAPLLDDTRAHVRQCAACIMMNRPVEKFSSMPSQIFITVYDKQGRDCFSFKWNNLVPDAVQQPAWIEFVANHMMYLEDKKRSRG